MDFDEPEGIDEVASRNSIKTTIDGIAEIKKVEEPTSKPTDSKESTDFEETKKKLLKMRQ